MAVIDLRKQNYWEQLMPNLVQMYAQGLMQQHFKGEETQSGFTLGADQIRYDSQGNVIARGKVKTPEAKPPTFTSLEGSAFQKWLDEKPLTAREQRIIDKRFAKSGTRQSPADILKNAKARQQAWAEGFEKYVGRPPDKLEARKYFLNDMYGILEPEELPEGLTETDVNYNMKKYKKTRAEIIDQYIKSQGK